MPIKKPEADALKAFIKQEFKKSLGTKVMEI